MKSFVIMVLNRPFWCLLVKLKIKNAELRIERLQGELPYSILVLV
jgi:hypothetical protein